MSDQDKQPPATTTDSGIPVSSDEFSLTAGPGGPTVLHDHYLVQKMQHFNRERVPERVVHARGSAAHGFFEVTNDISQFTKAAFLQPGTRTPTFLRMSTVAGEMGSIDTARDPRGFALKFYTEEGNHDLVGNNTPVFFVRDAVKFQDFIHSQKRNPDNGLRDNNVQWDFWTLSPESAHQVTVLMSDRGTPRTLRNMNGYGSHTFSLINAGGTRHWVKFHFKTVQGVENFTDAEAQAVGGEDPDFHRRDLWRAIDTGDCPEWKLEIQVMPFEDAANYRFNPFDVTKVWSHADYPPIEVGRLVLDRNPENHFAEVEQSAFSPANLVPGIGLSPDKMLMGRIFSYHDTHLYRVGTNYEQLPINRPQSPVHSYNQDGAMTSLHSGDQPHYAPNSAGGPVAQGEHGADLSWGVPEGEIGRYANVRHAEDDDFGQARSLINQVMEQTDRDHLVTNIVGHASKEVTDEMQYRVIAYWSAIDETIGARVAAGLQKGNGASSGPQAQAARELVATRANRA